VEVAPTPCGTFGDVAGRGPAGASGAAADCGRPRFRWAARDARRDALLNLAPRAGCHGKATGVREGGRQIARRGYRPAPATADVRARSATPGYAPRAGRGTAAR